MKTPARIIFILLFLSSYLFIFGDTTDSEDLPSADSIISDYIEAVGGQKAISRFRTRICKGREVDNRPYSEPLTVSPFICFASVPDKWVMNIFRRDSNYKEGFDGINGWHSDENGIVFEECLERSKLAWLMNPQSPLKLVDIFGEMQVEGIVKVDGHFTYMVNTERDDAYYSLYFDVVTGLLIRIGYYWYLEDYRPVEGVLLPFRVTRSRKGGSTTWIFDDISHNKKIDETVFMMVKEKDAIESQ